MDRDAVKVDEKAKKQKANIQLGQLKDLSCSQQQRISLLREQSRKSRACKISLSCLLG